jgi:hypothetical protein
MTTGILTLREAAGSASSKLVRLHQVGLRATVVQHHDRKQPVTANVTNQAEARNQRRRDQPTPSTPAGKR